MPLVNRERLLNYEHRYQFHSKFIFTPTAECRRKGKRLLRFFKNHEFPPYFFHYRSGGHVAALQSHADHRFFFKIDLQNFFYSIARNRVADCLRGFGFWPARPFAKWSCVINPYNGGPRYVLPIGFVQSPLLASLALLRSPVLAAITRAQARGCAVSVYFDDFIGSGPNEFDLTTVYNDILVSFEKANLTPNPRKLLAPAHAIKAFNCDLSHGLVRVSPERVQLFFSEPRTRLSSQAFRAYEAGVASNNQQG
jgi:hypothetical protein